MSLKAKFEQINESSSLLESQEVQKIADDITHFCYNNKDDILNDLQDEIQELKTELDIHDSTGNNLQRVFEELGDVLFVLGNLANRYHINSNEALKYSVQEFKRRIVSCEDHYRGSDISNASKTEMLSLWKEAKISE